jgi:queuine/archaeosine tRNA-ribosyltransferase
VLEFYEECQFDLGLSLDHVVLGYSPDGTVDPDILAEWRRRFDMTIDFAEQFLTSQKSGRSPVSPIGVAQGWSPHTYADAVTKLQNIGYDYIALGGMVPLKTSEILACLEAVSVVRNKSTKLHLLGVSRFDQLGPLNLHGVASFDSTAPLKQAFMDDKNNYHTPSRAYTAVRIPQVGENVKFKRAICAGSIDQDAAQRMERRCLQTVLQFAERSGSLEAAVSSLAEYESLWHGKKDDSARYRETLSDRPWEKCKCSVCQRLGVHVVIFRGAERNRRRGFHNLFVLRNRLQNHLSN